MTIPFSWRSIPGRLLTGLAFVLVWFALLAPNQLSRFSWVAFVRVPIEGLVLLAAVLLLPARVRWLHWLAGGLLGLLVIVRMFDLVLFAALDRPFNPVTDWGNIGPGIGVVADSIGRSWADLLVLLALLLLIGLLVLVTLAVRRLGRVALRHRTA